MPTHAPILGQEAAGPTHRPDLWFLVEWHLRGSGSSWFCKGDTECSPIPKFNHTECVRQTFFHTWSWFKMWHVPHFRHDRFAIWIRNTFLFFSRSWNSGNMFCNSAWLSLRQSISQRSSDHCLINPFFIHQSYATWTTRFDWQKFQSVPSLPDT